MNEQTRIYHVLEKENNQRIDVYLANQAQTSRSHIQKAITAGYVQKNNLLIKNSSEKVKENDIILLNIPAKINLSANPASSSKLWEEIEILAEHEHFLIIHKPAGLCTHAAHPNDTQETLADWITYHGYFKEHSIEENIRQGIVHRLDKETSGVMIIARTYYAHSIFTDLFQKKEISKTYRAIVEGIPAPLQGVVDFRIMRDPLCPVRMTHSRSQGREAETHYQTLASFETYSLIECKPTTGRTHQIRVHMAALNHPLLGDMTYGKKSSLINRHALHASMIAFTFDEKEYIYHAPLPADMHILLNK